MTFFAELKRRNVIRVAIAYAVLSWLVLQIADVMVDFLGLPVALGRIVLALLAIGLIPVLLFSWVYELTPEGIKRESEIAREQSITDHTAKRLDIAVIVLIVVAMGLYAVDRFVLPGGAGEPPARVVADADGRVSVAVLPFLNLSDDEGNEYLSDGLTETLLHTLAQVDGLRVAARTSAFAFKDTNADIRDIARQLNVSTILEGSVQHAGGRLRITAQLIDAASGTHIWSQSFDRDMQDVFRVQDDIATSVVDALAASVLGDDGADLAIANRPRIDAVDTSDPEAFDHYLRGLGPRAEDSHTSLPVAEQAFMDALIRDPGFTEARLALTSTYISMGDTALISQQEAVNNARAALRPLVASAPDDPVVAGLDAYIDFLGEDATRVVFNQERIEYFNRLTAALARAPNEPILYEAVAEVLQGVAGREEEQLAFVERGLEVDPFSSDLLIWKGRVLAWSLDRPDDALAAYEKLREVAPGNPNGYAFPGFIFIKRGDNAQAIRQFAEAAAVDRRDHELAAFVATALMDLGLLEQAAPWVARANLLDADGGAAQSADLLYRYLSDDRDGALALAEDILRGQASNRRGVYGDATLIYSLEMLRRERLDEALALFETLAPGSTTDPGYHSDDPFGRQLFYSAQSMRAATLSDEDIARWRETYERVFDTISPEWRTSDGFAVMRFVYGYDTRDEAAAALARQIGEANRYRQYDRLSYRMPSHEPLMSHPDVIAAVETAEARLEREKQRYVAMAEAGDIPGA